MILRRVIDHFRKQEWTAIAIDFLIVVIGVFVGVQAANWNNARLDEERQAAALDALQTEYERNIGSLTRWLEGYSERNDLEIKLARALASGAIDAENRADFERAFAQIMYFSPVPVSDSTYESLKQSGDLALIKEREILVALNELARRVAWMNDQRLAFRDGISENGARLHPYVFHIPTDDPTITAVEVDYDGLMSDRGAISAAVQISRMKSIFQGYVVRLTDEAIEVCDLLAAETGRKCAGAEGRGR